MNNCITEYQKTWIDSEFLVAQQCCALKPSHKHRLGPRWSPMHQVGGGPARVTDMPCHSHDSLKKLYCHVSLSPFTKR